MKEEWGGDYQHRSTLCDPAVCIMVSLVSVYYSVDTTFCDLTVWWSFVFFFITDVFLIFSLLGTVS